MAAPNFTAAGNIKPSRFVIQDTASNHAVLQASTGEDIIGISQDGLRRAPRNDVTETYAAVAGEQLRVFGIGDECLLCIGTGGCTAGDYLKSDSDGCGVTAAELATADIYWGARALETRVAGELARVLVSPGAGNV